MNQQIKNLLETIKYQNNFNDKLNGYIKYLQNYIDRMEVEDLDNQDYFSFEKWLELNKK